MLGNVDFQKISQRFEAYWELKNTDRPLVSASYMTADLSNHPAFSDPSMEAAWLDVKAIHERIVAQFSNMQMFGEYFPHWNINFGPDILGAVLGCELSFSPWTSWSTPFVDSWETFSGVHFDEQNKWWQKLLSFTDYALAHSNGGYFVGLTDLHPGGDGVCAIRGVEATLMDLADDPELIKKMTFELLPVFKKMVDDTYALTEKHGQKGSSNWTRLWHPGKFYVTSCDMCCMLSKPMFDEYILPELAAESDYLDASIYHLDGPDAIKHLDSLLSIDSLNGIQYVPGDGCPPASSFIPMLKKIQAAGKVVQTYVLAEELDIMYEAFKDDPRGIFLQYNCNSKEEAELVARRYNL